MVSPKRYLLLIDALGSGGAERQMCYLATELRKAGHEVKLVTFYDTADFYTDELRQEEIDIEARLDGRSKLRRPFVIRSLVKSFRPDMVIAYKDGASMAACVARVFTRFQLTVSERNTSQSVTRKEKLKFNLYRLADHVVPNSFSQAKFIAKYFPFLNKKVTVITNMIDTDRFRPSEVTREEHNPLRILTVGRVMPQKNPENYLRAISLLKQRGIQAEFHWYGGEQFSHPEYKKGVLKLALDLGISDMVHFYSQSKEIATVYQSHDIFLLPSLFEGFPNALCEAMACGLPTVASNTSDSPQIMSDSRFQVSPFSPVSIAEALYTMINLTATERKEISKVNRQKIVNLCAPEVFIRRYTSL